MATYVTLHRNHNQLITTQVKGIHCLKVPRQVVHLSTSHACHFKLLEDLISDKLIVLNKIRHDNITNFGRIQLIQWTLHFSFILLHAKCKHISVTVCTCQILASLHHSIRFQCSNFKTSHATIHNINQLPT